MKPGSKSFFDMWGDISTFRLVFCEDLARIRESVCASALGLDDTTVWLAFLVERGGLLCPCLLVKQFCFGDIVHVGLRQKFCGLQISK